MKKSSFIGTERHSGVLLNVFSLRNPVEQYNGSPCERCDLNKTSLCSFKICTGAGRKDGVSVRFEFSNKAELDRYQKQTTVKETSTMQKSYKEILEDIAKDLGPEAFGPRGGVRYQSLSGIIAQRLNLPKSVPSPANTMSAKKIRVGDTVRIRRDPNPRQYAFSDVWVSSMDRFMGCSGVVACVGHDYYQVNVGPGFKYPKEMVEPV